jgi:hypothetical protein
MNNRTLFTLIAMLGCWLQGVAVLGAEQSVSPTYFPLAVGNRWVYEFSTSTDAPPIYESVAVIGQDGNAFSLWIKDDFLNGDTLTGNGYQETIFRTAEGLGYPSRVRGTPQKPVVLSKEPQLFLKVPLTKGATWENNWGKYEVTAVDVTETVPAGTFKNCVEVTYRAYSGDVTIVSLYAPGVGLIQRDETFIAIAFAGGGPVRSLLRLKDWKVQEPVKDATNGASAGPGS